MASDESVDATRHVWVVRYGNTYSGLRTTRVFDTEESARVWAEDHEPHPQTAAGEVEKVYTHEDRFRINYEGDYAIVCEKMEVRG